MEEIRCVGCGALIQSDDDTKIGFVPKAVLDKGDFTHLYCKRCHRIREYNEVSRNEMPHELYLETIKSCVRANGCFIYITDIFNYPLSLDPTVIKLINKKDVILVLNKLDLLPKSLKENTIKRWARHIAKENGLVCKEIILTSTKNKYNIDNLVALIDRYASKRDVYIIGQTNVGKSSIINAILKSLQITNVDVLTTSVNPATTIDLVKIPYTLDTCIIDTPGLVSENNLLSYLSPNDFKHVLPSKEVRPTVFQLEPKQSILLNAFARFDFLEGDKQGFAFYLSNNLKISRSKLENGIRIFENGLDNLFNYETKNLEFDSTYLEISKPSYVYIGGLGFIYIRNKAKISITKPLRVGVVVVDAISG